MSHFTSISGASFLTAKEVAQKLKVRSRTIHRAIKMGYLKAHIIGNSFRISETDFNHYLKVTRL